jgi:hypothetical protein
MGPRIALTFGLLAALIALYWLMGVAAVVPLPRSLESVAQRQTVSRGQALVAGYFSMQPFTANGNGLPPYALTPAAGATDVKVNVQPTLSDLRPYRVVALLDLATGDGSEWNPMVVRTVGSVTAVTGGLIVGGLVLLALLFWIAGYLAPLVGWRARESVARRATR